MGSTPLLGACFYGSLDTVKLLLDKGARLAVANEYGITPAWAAAASGNVELLTFLQEKGCALTAVTDDGDTLLHAAVRAQDLAMVKLLLAKGLNPQVVNDAEESALFAAIHSASQDDEHDTNGKTICTELIERGCKLSAKNIQGDTPLHVAVNEYHPDLIPLLIAKGAKLDAKNNAGQTPLLLIEQMEDADARKAFLKAIGKE
jgi:ankyrin repeat protein